MRRFPWPDEVWTPSERAVRDAFRYGAYRVTIRITVNEHLCDEYADEQDDSHGNSDVSDSFWGVLQQQLTAGSEGVLLDGGASIRRVAGGNGEEIFEVVSGGEDALDSLSYTINVTLAETAAKLGELELSVESEGGIR